MVYDKRLLVLQSVRRAGRIIRQEIAQQLGVSLSLISKLTTDLIACGLLQEVGRINSEGSGRPAELLGLAPQAGYAVGLDIDAHRQIAVVINLVGEVLTAIDEPPPPITSRTDIINNLRDLVERTIRKSGLPHHRVFGVGVGLRCTVDPITGITHGWPGVGNWETAWIDFPLRDALRRVIDMPHIVVDDIVRSLGIAEAHYGQGSLNEDFLYVLVDTGVGMAIMMGGEPYIGFSHIAGEIGHIQIESSNESYPCPCGSHGCLEGLVSTTSILTRLRKRLEISPSYMSILRNNEELTIEKVLEAAAQGNKVAYQLLTEAGEEFGHALAMVINLFGPRLIIVGGVMATSDIFLDTARRTVKVRALEKATQACTILPTTLDVLAGARGAATSVLNQLFQPGSVNILTLCTS